MEVRLAGIQPDVVNPKHLPRSNDVSVAEMPDAPQSQWIVECPGIKKGRLETTHLKNTTLAYEPTMTIYTPAGYKADAKPYDVAILFDGDVYLHGTPTPTILDNLISEGRIPPVVAVFLTAAAQGKNWTATPSFRTSCRKNYLHGCILDIT
jgi:enterochelin esterase-like enzyme